MGGGGGRAHAGAEHPAPQAPLNDSYRNLCSAFYRDVGAYRALLESPGCLRWDSAFHILGGYGENRGDKREGRGRGDGSGGGGCASGTGGAGRVQGTGAVWERGGAEPLLLPSPGLQDGVLTVSQDIALAKGVELEVTEYYTYLHPDPSTLPEPQ